MSVKNKLLLLGIIYFLFFIQPSYGLQFSVDNYSSAPILKYSFTFNGKDWFEHQDVMYLNPWGFKTINFSGSIPIAWKIEVDNGILECQNYCSKEKSKVTNVVTLNFPEFMQENDLLLDVINLGNNKIMANIIDLNGNRIYSNTISCEIKHDQF